MPVGPPNGRMLRGPKVHEGVDEIEEAMVTDKGRRIGIRAAGLSDVGRCRQANQDQFFVGRDFDGLAIADGMGGHAAGEVASDIAIAALAESMGQGGEERVSPQTLPRGAEAPEESVLKPMLRCEGEGVILVRSTERPMGAVPQD